MNIDQAHLREKFARLEMITPPPELIGRIWQARRRRLRRQLAIVSVAAAGVFALPMILQLRQDASPPQTAIPHAATLPDDWEADVRAIDHALQQAYLRNADESEIAPLWQARGRLFARRHATASAAGFI